MRIWSGYARGLVRRLSCAGLLVVLGCSSEVMSNAPDAGTPQADATAQADAQPTPAERGKYLVNNVAGCGHCHTPYIDGQPDMTNYLAGVPDRHNVAGVGGINSANITSDQETGIGAWSDEEIERAIRHGVRKDGAVMWYQMPYYELANLTDADVAAIIAYLRTVPAVRHELVRKPYTLREAPFSLITGELVPASTLAETDPNYASAQRGRYLASFGCLHCHTRNATDGGDYRKDVSAIFGGNQRFAMSPIVPKEVYSKNLTPHDNGIAGLLPENIRETIKNGGSVLCPPMASLSKYYLSGMTDADALDIGNFLTTLAPVDTGMISICMP